MDTNSDRNLQGLQRVKKGGERGKWKTETQSAEINRKTDNNFSGLWIIPKAAEEKKMQQEQGE